ncbi:4-hydroxy-tetrahydrodipicolinate reductase [Eubacterium limosum]|uniref:4-hydroxy-tetrahydrodipicolinate reductase n=1 Tax=Eubacterium limosum TaxID=1736 RepID=A0ABT5UPQ1_EUBLI|nr:4-hydroxy-tetrahydrodipicolinate reductase [Eubacterium limosum]MCB6570039.1 4-hydroxy-tetrahydrodipicolinate reductase [Eubacterium limosum]MDE1469836.1 4-hydroxy-tetrahydrodipicolinate reductase [Eubacterium limosum]
MLNILLSGVGGAMGHMLQTIIGEDPDCQIVAGFDINTDQDTPFPVYSDLSQCAEKADVIIDFSHYKAFDSIFGYARDTRTPIVIATTGLSEANLADIEAGSKEFPVFRTANMSLGINLLAKALRDMAGALEDGFDIEIIEKHHNKKADAPSGTALLLADAVNDGLENKKDYTFGRHGRDCKRKPLELGIHAVRGGTIPGEHTVLFAGNDELIEIRHTALSKKVFASGAVTAAKYLVDQAPGLFNMEMLIDN